MIRIAVVEDDVYLREELIHTFRKAGYDAFGITCFQRAEQELMEEKPGLAVLDVNLPGKSGYELCKSIKKRCAFPILILTARDTLSDELMALGLGADDFLTKPCHPDRLLARTERVLAAYARMGRRILAGALSLDPDTYKLVYGGSFLLLAETEGKILKVLMEQYPRIVEKGELFAAVWGTEKFVDENILQVNVSRLRKNLAVLGLAGVVRNIRGQGYVLEMEEL